ncbi:MAG: hypothetical protein ACJ8DJ_12885 [Gemmatimonadales bacterium]
MVVILGGYTAILAAVIGGGGGNGGGVKTVVEHATKKRPLTPMERTIASDVQNAALFQNENTDVPYFRRPRITTINCKRTTCNVSYSVAVPGRGRILYQQGNMVRAIFHDTKLQSVVLKVVRVEPTGPDAVHKSEEETPPGFPLIQTTCFRSKQPGSPKGRTQKQAQAQVSGSCQVKAFDQGQLHGGKGGKLKGPG